MALRANNVIETSLRVLELIPPATTLFIGYTYLIWQHFPHPTPSPSGVRCETLSAEAYMVEARHAEHIFRSKRELAILQISRMRAQTWFSKTFRNQIVQADNQSNASGKLFFRHENKKKTNTDPRKSSVRAESRKQRAESGEQNWVSRGEATVSPPHPIPKRSAMRISLSICICVRSKYRLSTLSEAQIRNQCRK